ncbi:unnamed protein product [Didymodactylos carnosus]|uniref:ETS domain-containing protein n=1 Tax=Didymodactylos carnosus TaxID=1234261 RepID=A0A813X4I1_9BILA|nr:unnamed protein product [Didymodactylos carnosus]CAF3652001.1 unnamed protein product [Didymodactylos carnosus]
MLCYPEQFTIADDETPLEELKTPEIFSCNNPFNNSWLLNQPEKQIKSTETSDLFVTNDFTDEVLQVVDKDDFTPSMSFSPADSSSDGLPSPSTLPSEPPSLETTLAHAIEPKKLAEWMVEDYVSHKRRRPYLQEFLRLLLDKPHYLDHASYININKGIFKLHKPQEIATLWQNVKGRYTVRNMTYDKMARALRLYYKSGIMTPVNGRYTFQFGPQSGFNTSWIPKLNAHKSLTYSTNHPISNAK